ncbi:MAG: heavy metal translocating P-type ATPase [Moraxellaceae bacterium]|nr:heavy metal translocating P-type ATPase [Moraxellaceae bacterium]MDZ4385941.1 heavy metal translocating P-type ATPase [Moraxellaceae bacterium]
MNTVLTATHCYHCGLPNPQLGAATRYQTVVLDQTRDFCCPGCVAVAQCIVEGQLENYYQERDGLNPTATQPVPDELLQRYDHPVIQQDFVHREGRFACSDLSLEGISCAACAWLIERRLNQEPEVFQASVNLSNHRLRIVWDDSKQPLSQLLAIVEKIGYRARPFQPDSHAAQLRSESRRQLMRVAVAGLGTMQAMMYGMGLYLGAFQGIADEHRDYLRWISGLVTTPVFFYAGWPFYQAAVKALKARTLTMDVPVSIALIMAFIASWIATVSQSGETYFDSVCMFIFFLLSSRYLELKARQRAGETAASLLTLTPQLTHRQTDDGQWLLTPASELHVGDIILINAGETIPTDATLIDGHGSVSEALLTGEPIPVKKSIGDALIGGSINTDQPLKARVSQVGKDTLLATLQQLLARALSEKPLVAQRADKMAHYFVARVLVFAVVVYGIWWFVDKSQAFWITIAVLVATCPCALSLATPAALTTATHQLAREGFLITRGHVLDSLDSATHIVFDKTGTLTEGRFSVDSVELLADLERKHALSIMAALEAGSAHPIAKALQQLANTEDVTASTLDHPAHQHAGAGVSGEINRQRYQLGHAGFALNQSDSNDEQLTLWLSDAEFKPLLKITLSDQARPEAAPVVAAIHERGLSTWIMSGDHSQVPQQLAKQLGINHVQGGMSAEEKQQAIAKLQADGAVVMMVGDGVNDAPCLGQAHLGVAMSSGTDLAQTSADVVLLGDRLAALIPALALSKRTAAIIKQNLRWAIMYNLAILPPAAMGYVPPWLAALGMSLSSLVVVLNALRLRKAR